MTRPKGPLIDIRLNLWLLKALALLDPEDASPWMSALHRLYTGLTVVAYLLLLVPTWATIFRDWGDVDAVVNHSCIALPILYSVVRCFFFVCRRRDMTRLISGLLRFEDYYCPRVLAAERASIILKISREARITTIFFNTMGALIFATISLSPMVIGEQSAPDALVTRRLPVEATYFFDCKRSPCYEAVYVVQVLTFSLLIPAIMAFDTAFMAYARHARAQLLVLDATLRNLRRVAEDGLDQGDVSPKSWGAAAVEPADALEPGRRTRQCIIHCVEHHNAIIEFVKQLNDWYNPVNIGIIVFSIAMIAVNTLKLTESSAEIADFLKFGALTSTAIFELYYYCRLCDDIIQQSLAVADAIFSCDWCDADAEVKLMVQMIITRANKPVKITVGRFKILSLEFFAAVMNSSYSFFAMLKQVKN